MLNFTALGMRNFKNNVGKVEMLVTNNLDTVYLVLPGLFVNT